MATKKYFILLIIITNLVTAFLTNYFTSTTPRENKVFYNYPPATTLQMDTSDAVNPFKLNTKINI